MTTNRDTYNAFTKALVEETTLRYEDALSEAISQKLDEGIFDPSTFKAIFLAGGSGTGKGSTLAKTTSSLQGFRVVDKDMFTNLMVRTKLKVAPDYELMKLFDPDKYKISQSAEFRGYADKLLDARMHLLVQGRLGIVIDSTASKAQEIADQKKQLEVLGYDCFMVFVSCELETAMNANTNRAGRANPKLNKDYKPSDMWSGQRVPWDILWKKWHEVMANLPTFSSMFGGNFKFVNTNITRLYKFDAEGNPVIGPDKKPVAADENAALIEATRSAIAQFASKPISNPKAIEWVKDELLKSGGNLQGVNKTYYKAAIDALKLR